MSDPFTSPTSDDLINEEAPTSGSDVTMVQGNTAEAVGTSIGAMMDRQRFDATAKRSDRKVVLPGGIRRVLAPNVRSRYRSQNASAFLGVPERILTDDWKRRHPRVRYEWAVSPDLSLETKAMVNSKRFTLVPPEALNKDCDFAMVGDQVTSFGAAITWMRHVLVMCEAAVWEDRHLAPMDEAVDRVATGGDDEVRRLEDQFGQSGFRAEADFGADERQEIAHFPG